MGFEALRLTRLDRKCTFGHHGLDRLKETAPMQEPKRFTDIVKAEAVSFGCQPTLRVKGSYHT